MLTCRLIWLAEALVLISLRDLPILPGTRIAKLCRGDLESANERLAEGGETCSGVTAWPPGTLDVKGMPRTGVRSCELWCSWLASFLRLELPIARTIFRWKLRLLTLPSRSAKPRRLAARTRLWPGS